MLTLSSDHSPLQWRPVCPIYPNPEIGICSSFRVLPEIFFSGKENVLEFLDSIDYGVLFHEIPTNLACAYLKGHLIGRAKDWFEVIDSSYVTGTPTDFAQLNQALTNSFPVVRNRSELEAEFYSSHQVRIQAPSDFVYKLLKIQKILNFEMTEENLLNCILMRLSPQIMDYVEVRNPTTKAQLVQLVKKYEERHRERDEGVEKTDGLDGERSKAEQVGTESSKGLAREETSKKKQWRDKRVRSEGSIEFSNNYKRRGIRVKGGHQCEGTGENAVCLLH
ncbi:uncharacterized protein NPIL_312861 [Nephila pilipes]|uniref:Retrotransposon gag domain-containing protein n=1 Tax=Nephila pilipes TaxID=299642 RepID=A0A8X6T2M4_NEPPI|nr:uncharacterized protein NPIL_312861 [Nephila pilipes]